MKTIIAIIGLTLVSCSKTYICTTTTITETPYYYNEHTIETELEGSKEDANQFELDNTSITNLYPEGSIDQKTICK